MDRLAADLDRQLGEWLREESTTRASAGLVEAVFARTTRTRQARRWWPPLVGARSRRQGPRLLEPGRARVPWVRASLAGVTAIVLVVAVLGLALRSISPGPGDSGGPSPSSSLADPATPALQPTPLPEATLLDGASTPILRLGRNAGPIDVVAAFDSIWVANIFSHDVSRIEPVTLVETHRIGAGTGPAWFAVTDDAVWVTDQGGQGLSRIDPGTNLAGAAVGEATPCGAPVLAFDSLWASACDSEVILRINPATSELLAEIPAAGYRWLALADGRLFTGDAAGLAEIDPTTESLTDLGFCCGEVMGSDGDTIWLKRPTEVVRMDPADGSIVASFPFPNAGSVTFAEDRAWLTASSTGAMEIDLASNEILRTIAVPGSTLLARELLGALWVTSIETSELWRIDP
jgi:streptogramin lyase